MPNQEIEVSFVGKSLALRMSNPVTGDPGHWEYHPICNISSVTGQLYDDFATLDPNTNQKKHRYPHDDMCRVIVEMVGEHQPDIDFDLNDVTNQPTWTVDQTGVEQAKSDINSWIAQCNDSSSGGEPLATEATQLDNNSLLNDIDISLAGEVNTHNTVNTSGAGSVPAGAKRGSVKNIGSSAGVWNGMSLPAGVGIPFGHTGVDDVYNEIPYDASGTTFIIEYTT